MLRYLKVWLILSSASFRSFINYRFGALLFLAGKITRFIFFLGFLMIIVTNTKLLSGYNSWQIMLIYLTFNFIDAMTQMLFREVYRFRQHILTGNFDLLLVKPVDSLFRILFGGTDLLDFLTLLPFMFFICYSILKIGNITPLGIFFYLIMIVNALVIAASFHVLVMALAVVTTEIDHAIMIYRDITGMGKIPVDVYAQPVRSIITFILPVGLMMTFPVKAMIGLLDPVTVFYSVLFGSILFFLSVKIWSLALRKYTSASS